ncbi:hypothetical protein HWV62_447 [Athelia sp. TMB]|nr:hypothetical protein HWV62_447 [Athelia sp. TMB]
MAFCASNLCVPPPTSPVKPIVQLGPPQRGELFRVSAAVKIPFLDHILKSGVTAKSYASTCMEDANSRYSHNPWRRGAKPCIIVERAKNKEHPRVFLIRVFTPTQIDTLPSIVRHYLIPIHDLSDGPASWIDKHVAFGEHIHTSPSWAEGTNHWVIGLPCDAKETAIGSRCVRKPTKSSLDGSHYFIDHVTMQKLVEACILKDQVWETKSKEEQVDGARKINTWKTVPAPQNKKFRKDGTRLQGSGGAVPADTYKAQLLEFERDKFNNSAKPVDGASVKTKASGMRAGGLRIRSTLLRHFTGGGWQ